MRETYLDLAIHMARFGSDALDITYRHTKQWLRGITDYDQMGNYAWKKGKFAANSYQFSSAAWPNRHLPNYKGVLHGEHVVPVHKVAKEWIEMVRNSRSEKEQRAFLDQNMVVVWITIAEKDRIGAAKLTTKMPKQWQWGDDIYARLKEVGIMVVDAGGFEPPAS